MEQPIDYPDLWKVLQKASQNMGLPHVIATSQSIHLTVQVGDESKGLRFLLRWQQELVKRIVSHGQCMVMEDDWIIHKGLSIHGWLDTHPMEDGCLHGIHCEVLMKSSGTTKSNRWYSPESMDNQ